MYAYIPSPDVSVLMVFGQFISGSVPDDQCVVPVVAIATSGVGMSGTWMQTLCSIVAININT